MKRYWKIFLLIGVIIGTFSTFYLQSSLALNKLPQFKIDHVSGDENEISNLSLHGYYMGDEDVPLELDREGTTYQRNFSYLDMLSMDHYPKIVRNLQKKHRNFMRGKIDGMPVFFENDEILIYADISMEFHYEVGNHSFKIDIEWLDKETNKRESLTSPVPTPERYEFMFAEAAQLVDDERLKLITRNNIQPEIQNDSHIHPHDYQEEIHIYTFDLSKKTLIDDEVLKGENFNLEVDNYSIDSYLVNTDDYIGPAEYIVVEMSASEMEMEPDGYVTSEIIEGHLIAYHLKTGEQTVIELPNEIDEHGFPTFYKDPVLYFEDYKEDQYKVVLYDIEQQQIITDQEFDMEQTEDSWSETYISEDKLYSVSSLKTKQREAFVKVYDLKTGESLYKGRIEEDDNKAAKDYRLELYIRGID